MLYLLKQGRFSGNTDPLPHLLVLDLNMPVMDGWAVLQEINKHQELKKIPVYVLTTSKSEEHMRKCKDLGCAGFFSKPPKLDELRIVLSQMLKHLSDNNSE